MKISDSEKKQLLEASRQIIGNRLGVSKMPDNIPHSDVKTGIFVTLSLDGDLRGCIGYVEPVMTLANSLKKASLAAAFEDPRFVPLSKEEFEKIKIEISLLTVPEVIEVDDPKEYPSKIIVGKDGLIIEKGGREGLLLPQVATEHGWDSEAFLEHTCLKAGLAQDEWLDTNVTLKKFQAEVFSE